MTRQYLDLIGQKWAENAALPSTLWITVNSVGSEAPGITVSTMERQALARVLRQANPFFLIAGPCVLESERVVMTVATRCERRHLNDQGGVSNY